MFKGFRYFMHYCWKQQKSYILYLLLGEVFQTVVFVSSIIFPKYIINYLFDGWEIVKAILCVTIFLAILFFSNIMSALSKYYAERSRDQMYRKFSISFAQQVMESDYCNMEDPKYMDLREKALKCMTGNYGFAGTVLLFVNLIGKLLLIGSIITIVMTLDVVMLLICALLIAINVWINNYMGKRNAQIDLESVLEKRKVDYYHQLGDDPRFAKEIRLNGLHNWILDLYREQFIRVHQFTKKRNANTCKGMVVGRVSTFLQQCTAYGYLIYKVLKTGLSVGGFTMYLNAILSFNTAITELLMIVGRLKQCGIYLKPFEEFMRYSRQLEETVSPVPLEEDITKYVIRFEHVYFRYPGQEQYVLRDVSCEIHSCEKVAVVGENGAGKTTFVKLLTRLYDPTEGQILFCGVDIRELDYSSYRKLLAVVFQDFQLLKSSIRENIMMDQEREDKERMTEVLHVTGFDEKIQRLKKGLDTQVYKDFDPEGIELSGGEAQKLAICRVYYKNSPICILDEPTAALDPKAECEIYENFQTLVHGKTALFISHRLASSRMCDRVFVFRNGELVEDGSHAQLMKQAGLYCELFSMQAQYFYEELTEV